MGLEHLPAFIEVPRRSALTPGNEEYLQQLNKQKAILYSGYFVNTGTGN